MNIAENRWLLAENSFKRSAWNQRNLVTIDNIPLEEAIYKNTEFMVDAVAWMPPEDYRRLRGMRRTWLNQQAYNWLISDEAIPSGFQEITVTPESERRAEEEMVNMRDLSLYYNGTVNYADGKICRIIGSNNKGMICSPLEGGKAFITTDLKPINDIVTGFINTPIGCIRCFRKPTRTAKEGINTESIEAGSIIPWESYPNEFMDMLNNIYPSEEEAIKIAKEEHINVAVSKFKYYDWVTAKFINILKNANKERVRYELD